MDIIENEVWAAQPDISTVCRCCLSASGNWDLITPYYNEESGVKEVLSEMLEERFQISLSFLSEEGASRLICNMCWGRLRDSYTFRQQVLSAEQRFLEYYISKYVRTSYPSQGNTDDTTTTAVKIEIKVEPSDYFPGESENVEESMSNVATTENPITELIHENCVNDDNRIQSTNTDSDAPAMETSTEEVETETNQANSKNNKSKSCKPTAANSKTEEHKINLRSDSEQNRLLQQNIAMMLQHSTIVPFRVLNNTNKKYTCQYCIEKYSIFDDLRKHFYEKHSNVEEYEIMATLEGPVDNVKAEISDIGCKICYKTFETLEDLATHLAEVHKKVYHRLKNEPSHGIVGIVLNSDFFILP